MKGIRRIVAGVAWVAALAASAAEVRIVGTDLLGQDFSAAIHAGARQAGTSVLVALDGSRPGLGRLRSNWADMGLLTLPAAESGQLSAFHVETLAYHCVWVLVAEDCPLREISLPQLAAIFGARGGKSVRSWNELGVSANGWGDKAFETLAPEMGAGVGLEFFRSVVLGGAALANDVIRYRDARDVRSRFERDAHAIVISTIKPEAGKLRALAISPLAGAAGVMPTAVALQRGEYPLRLPLQLVLPHDRKEKLWAWIAWWRSDEAARAFERAGLVVAPRGE